MTKSGRLALATLERNANAEDQDPPSPRTPRVCSLDLIKKKGEIVVRFVGTVVDESAV